MSDLSLNSPDCSISRPVLVSCKSDNSEWNSSAESTCASSFCSISPQLSEEKSHLSKLYKLAYVADDVPLCVKFAQGCWIPQGGASGQMLVRMVRMLHLCDYTDEVIDTTLAVALLHLDRIYRVCDPRMDDTERTCIAIMAVFNAHCYVEDEACPLKYWQRNIFAQYCNVKVLTSASMKLLRLLKFNLSAKEEDVVAKLEYLRN